MADLAIDSVDIIDCSAMTGPGDDTHAVAVHAAGLTGWYGPVRPTASRVLRDGMAARAVGSRVGDHSGLVDRLRGDPGYDVTAAVSWAIGALDCAVWDLHARAEGVSVAELLGAAGPPTAVPAYASFLTLDVSRDTSAQFVADVAGDGWQFTKWSLRPSPDLAIRANAAQLAGTARRVSRLAGRPAAFDALWTWTGPLATAFSELVDTDDIAWLEESQPSHTHPWYNAPTAQALALALGERVLLGDDTAALLQVPSLAAFTLDVVGCGGLTRAIHLVHQAQAADVMVYPHGRSLVPAIHLATAFPDAVPAVEYQVQWQPRRDRLFDHPIAADKGTLTIPQPRGLGPVPRRS